MTGPKDYIGLQRIQTSNISSDGSTNAGEPAAFVRAMLNDQTCRDSSEYVITVEAGPRPGTIAVTADYPGGSSPRTDYVGVVAMKGGSNTATIVLPDRADANSASTWTYLGSLMEAAAKR